MVLGSKTFSLGSTPYIDLLTIVFCRFYILLSPRSWISSARLPLLTLSMDSRKSSAEFSLTFLKCYGVESRRWAKDSILHSFVFSEDCIGVYFISFMPWDGYFYTFQRGFGELFCRFLGVLRRHSRRCGFGFHQRAWCRGRSFQSLDWSLYNCTFLLLKGVLGVDFDSGSY